MKFLIWIPQLEFFFLSGHFVHLNHNWYDLIVETNKCTIKKKKETNKCKKNDCSSQQID